MKRTTMTGEQIKQMRKEMQLRQQDCADIVGVGLRQWQKYEAGDPCKQLYIDVIKSRV